MKNMQIEFTKVFKAVVAVVFFGLVLGAFTVPLSKASAQMVSGSIIATPDTIDAGQSTQLRWNSFDATSVSITPGIGNVAPSGSMPVSPSQTTTYTLHLSNSSGATGQGTATVFVRGVQQNNPTVNLTADDNSLNSGESTTLRWTSTNATSCTASGAWSGSKNTGANNSEGTGPLTSTRTYSITCRNDAGNSAFDSETITVSTVQGNGPTVNLTADDTRIDEGDETTIRWTSTNADSCTASGGRNGWSGSRNRSGQFDTGDLFNDTTYTITCTNQFGSATDSETVRVDEDDDNDGDRPTVNIYANPSTVNYNGSSVITWTSRDADRCRSTGGTSGWPSSSRGRSGTFYANSLTSDTSFSITCTNDDGSASDSVTVRVNNFVNNDRPIVNIYADSTNIAYGGTTFVRWTTVNATSCYASGGSAGWAGSKSIGPGSFYTGSLYSGRTYILTCTNNTGSATDSVTVNVRGRTITVTPPPPTSLVLITSSIDRNQPILPTLDNTRPHIGDEINYTVTYQNIGTAAIRNLSLRLDLPYEVDYMFSNPSNPTRSGNTLIFSLGSLPANGTGTVTVRVRVREDAAPGALLNFPAVLSYTDPAGFPQSVSANVSAQVWSGPEQSTVIDERTVVPLGASIFGAGFWPTSLFGWLLFLILVLILVLLAKSLFAGTAPILLPRKTVTTTVQQH